MKRTLSWLLAIALLLCCGVVPCMAEAEVETKPAPRTGGDLTRLNVPKLVYAYDEPIMISAIGSGTDWVGIYSPTHRWGSLYWTYVTEVCSGKEFNMRTVANGNVAMADLEPGTYTIRLMPNDTTKVAEAVAWVEITVLTKEGTAVMPAVETETTTTTTTESTTPAAGTTGGNTSFLTVSKSVYAYNEPIMVSAVGSGQDWGGLYAAESAQGSKYWTYVTEVGSGAEFDMRKVAHIVSPELPAGKYVIRLMPNDTTKIDQALAWAEITIEEPVGGLLDRPVSAEYVLAKPGTGYSEGTLTVTGEPDTIAKDIVCYWANEDGRVPGYTPLAKFKITGETTVREIPAFTLIPPRATKLQVHIVKDGKLCADYVEVALPEGAASQPLGEPIVEFQVVSDVHINSGDNYASNFVRMLKDAVAVSPESLGVFIVGDVTDNGTQAQLDRFVKLHSSVEGAPDYYMVIGNHDLGGCNEQFIRYTLLPDGSHPASTNYDFWLNGYHFIFIDGNAPLYTAGLLWLDKALAQDRDENRPIFLFTHQSIYNTVSGSLPGQGWHGAKNPADLAAILKKYPEVIMFNGHSHWELDSDACMYARTEELPTIFNTASVGYLWSSYDIITGKRAPGSQGYHVRVYEDKVAVLGREYTTSEWVSSAQFIVE